MSEQAQAAQGPAFCDCCGHFHSEDLSCSEQNPALPPSEPCGSFLCCQP
jgi:hypothetical protein